MALQLSVGGRSSYFPRLHGKENHLQSRVLETKKCLLIKKPFQFRFFPQTRVYDPKTTIDFPFEDEEVSPEISASPPPTPGRIDIVIDNDIVKRLDLKPATDVLAPYLRENGGSNLKGLLDQTIGFKINYKFDDPLDPREFSELPDVRLWFVKLDATYPWLPAVLDWRAGELARYAAMLVPHQMSRRLGLVFNPEALELFAMSKLFVTYNQLKDWEIQRPDLRCKDMLKLLGFSVDDALFVALESTLEDKN